jgi:hypothetical protein
VLADADVAFTGDGEATFTARPVMPFTNPRVERKGCFSGKANLSSCRASHQKGSKKWDEIQVTPKWYFPHVS